MLDQKVQKLARTRKSQKCSPRSQEAPRPSRKNIKYCWAPGPEGPFGTHGALYNSRSTSCAGLLVPLALCGIPSFGCAQICGQLPLGYGSVYSMSNQHPPCESSRDTLFGRALLSPSHLQIRGNSPIRLRRGIGDTQGGPGGQGKN